MKKIFLLAAGLVMLVCGSATAGNISIDSTIGQTSFRTLSKELGMALAYKNTAPPHPLGITGFDAGVELSAIDIKKESAYWKAAFQQDAPSYLFLPKLRARKGLPFGIDIGAMYSNLTNTNIQLVGVEVSKSILDGTLATPALGVRATYTRLAGVPDIDLQTVGIDASIGKGILFLTPYAGAGMVWIDSKPSGNLKVIAPNVKDEKIYQPRFFAGLEIKPIPLIRVVGEVEYALRPIYSLKAAVGF